MFIFIIKQPNDEIVSLYIEKLNLNLNDIMIVQACNKLGKVTLSDVIKENLNIVNEPGCKVIVIGTLAEKALKKHHPSKPYYKLPSEIDKKKLDIIIKKCHDYLVPKKLYRKKKWK